MSELKADKTFVFGEECEAYKKPEADKVIAEKDKDIVDLKEKYKELAKLHDKAIQACCDADKVIAHQKYKRCLAMAKWCGSEVFISDYEKDEPRMRWWVKWHKRWLELAEKFKEAK